MKRSSLAGVDAVAAFMCISVKRSVFKLKRADVFVSGRASAPWVFFVHSVFKALELEGRRNVTFLLFGSCVWYMRQKKKKKTYMCVCQPISTAGCQTLSGRVCRRLCESALQRRPASTEQRKKKLILTFSAWPSKAIDNYDIKWVIGLRAN